MATTNSNSMINPTTGKAWTMAELQAKLAEMESLVTAAQDQPLSLKTSEKGGLSVYGLGRFPVTLYASQWERLLKQSQRILEFIEANRAKLARKV